MAEVTNELIHEGLKKIQNDIALLLEDVRGVRKEIMAMREHVGAVRNEFTDFHDGVGTLEVRVDRIERRLGLSQPAH